MNIGQAILEAFESLASNKLRSGLTILGIVIGVGAVIAMLSIGTGAQNTITGSINGLGTNLLFVFSGNQQEKIRNIQPLTLQDANALQDVYQAPSVENVAPAITGNLAVTYGGQTDNASITGSTANYAEVRNLTLQDGSFFSQDQYLGRASVAVIGTSVADQLFGHEDGLVGQTIRINSQPFHIVGVLKSSGGGSFGNQDNVIIVPLTSAQDRLVHRANNRLDVIYLQAVDSKSVNLASDQVAQILRLRHRNQIGQDDFTIYSQQDFVSTAASITGVLTIFLGGIAAISLLVGGIGIMNIMLVSVTERTREIGLRKAIGARKRDILIQFLTESSLLSLLGGLIGIGLGWLIGFIVGRIAASSGTPFSPTINIQSILLATLFSTAVGLFFGIYPANRAAKLEPVEALRYE
jgi:putative ABC transport system permease protein